MTDLLAPAGIQLRVPQPADVAGMLEIMDPFVRTGDLLPRTPVDLARDLPTYVVAVRSPDTVVGTGSLKRYDEALAEIQALAVHASCQGTGVGRAVVDALTTRAVELGVRRLFALTRQPAFFHRVGFEPAAREDFPPKIWLDCSRCPRQHACDEIAVVKLLG